MATTLDLTYTGDDALNSTHASLEGNSSIATSLSVVAYNYDFPQSVLDNYNPNSPGDCSRPLGAACVRALEQHNMKDFSSSGLKLSVPECADTLGGLSDDVEKDPGVISVISKSQPTKARGDVLLLTALRSHRSERNRYYGHVAGFWSLQWSRPDGS